jgi:TDG/mug DNA glycosylase family protein
LRVVFCGINPGTLSGQLGQNFARPGNRFWKVLQGAGFTDEVLTPAAQFALLDYGVGITNLVARSSAAASELSAGELRAGRLHLETFVAEWLPAWVAVLGVQAYRTAFRRTGARIGRQPETIGTAGLWVLPNPSGLQARYQLPEMITLFAALRKEAFS